MRIHVEGHQFAAKFQILLQQNRHTLLICLDVRRPRDNAVRDKILTAGLDLLQEVGFNNATCDAIAERSGASKATIYRWWPNKAAVLIDAFVERLTPQLPIHDVSTLEEYVTLNLRQFTQVLMGDDGRLFAAVIAAAQSDPDVHSAFLTHWIKPRRALFRVLLERYQAQGLLPANYDFDQVLDVMYGPLMFLLMVRHGELTLAYAEGLARMVLNGLLPRN
jgi:AcrR family transcriptional regulator